MEGSLVAYKVFTNGSTLQASELNENLMQQSIAVFSNSAARTAAITSPVEGQMTYLEDTNQYASWNGSSWVSPFGLTHLLTQTIGSAVTSVVVNNVFSSAFDNYKMLVTTNGTTIDAFNIQLSNSTGSTYNSQGLYMSAGSSTLTGDVGNAQTRAQIGVTTASRFSVSTEILNPFVTSSTQFLSTSIGNGFFSTRGSNDTSTASSTGFTVSPASGNITGGIISVYGYKKD
jgi:hypothetical protein